jgi:hypothetical protein
LSAIFGAIKEGLDERKVEKEENEAVEEKKSQKSAAKKEKAAIDSEAVNARVASKFETSEE